MLLDKLPVIIASHKRFRLLKQTLQSLRENSDGELEIIIIDDSLNREDESLNRYLKRQKDIKLHFFRAAATLGQHMMWGANMASPSKYIYFSANDMYFLPHWDTILKKVLQKYNDIVIVGGRGMHGAGEPRPLDKDHQVLITGLQAGYSMMLRRKEWDKEGYFPNYDEDSWLSYQMRAKFNKVLGVVSPPVVLHCGLTSLMNPTGFIHDKQTMEWDKNKYPEVIFE